MSLAAAVAEAVGADVVAARRVGGGDINDAWCLELAGRPRAFVKTRTDAPAGEYALEAAGLDWLAEPRALRVPSVLAVSDDFLALEWIDSGRLDAAGEEELGRGLARTHLAGAPAFGALPPRQRRQTPLSEAAFRIGPLELPSGPAEDWPAFYAQARLLPLVERAGLSAAGVRAVERVCERLPELAGPAEPPARLHGDLWSGNVMADAQGRPVLIDPAAYGGHREVDLAMLRLFASPSRRTLDAYAEVAPLADGHEERVELWQLFPLLVHSALFGGGYRASVERVAQRYC